MSKFRRKPLTDMQKELLKPQFKFMKENNMCLETIKGVNEIGGFKTLEMINDKLVNAYPEEDGIFPITINHDTNTISFTIQNGPIKEAGINGCQLVTLVETAVEMLEKLNNKFPCDENTETLIHWKNGIKCQHERTKDREKRNVEGTSKI